MNLEKLNTLDYCRPTTETVITLRQWLFACPNL